MGLGIVVAPPLGMLLMQRTGNPLNVYKLRLASMIPSQDSIVHRAMRDLPAVDGAATFVRCH